MDLSQNIHQSGSAGSVNNESQAITYNNFIFGMTKGFVVLLITTVGIGFITVYSAIKEKTFN